MSINLFGDCNLGQMSVRICLDCQPETQDSGTEIRTTRSGEEMMPLSPLQRFRRASLPEKRSKIEHRLRATAFRLLALLRLKIVRVNKQECYFVLTRDDYISRTLYISGVFDFDKYLKCLRILGLGRADLLVDVGANIGPICIAAVNRNLANRALAIEPVKELYELLVRNIAANRLSERIHAVNVALGATNQSCITIRTDPHNAGDNYIDFSGEASLSDCSYARLTTLDDLLECPLDQRSLVWVDIQGFELTFLKGATVALRNAPPVVLEIWPERIESFGGTFSDLAAALGGYTHVARLDTEDERTHSLDWFKQEWSRLVDSSSQGDYIFFVKAAGAPKTELIDSESWQD